VRRLAVLGWIVLALATLAIALVPELWGHSEPQGAIVVDRAALLSGDQAAQEVSLPLVINPGPDKPHTVRYQIDLNLAAVPGAEPYLLIPWFNRRFSLSLGGEPFYDSAFHTLWAGPAVSTTYLVRLPRRAPSTGGNRLVMTIEVDRFIVPVYLSRLFLGSEAQLAPVYKWQTFVTDSKLMSVAAQVMLAAGLIVAFLFRPRDLLLSWLAALEAVAATVAMAMSSGFLPSLREVLPFAVALVSAYGLLSLGVALALLGRRPPTALPLVIAGVSAVTLACAVIGTPLARTISATMGMLFLFGGVVAATAVIAWGALRRGNVEARFMLLPALLLTVFLARDAYITATLPDRAFDMLAAHAGLVYVAAMIAVLMRRMSLSFEQLDRSNEMLALKLAEREAELAVLARQEQDEATRRVREHERQRLTHDLHDGLSGHLASIIALSERADVKPIEAAAREALNDLRLVIYSLDLDDSDLPLALANLRERLSPQLHRLGVELDWSMAGLPEVSGITPGNALFVLRILQEAITNALRHGPARRIAIRGSLSECGRAAITIENDGHPFVAGSGGRGLENMRRRAEQLHAKLEISALERGTKVRLLLPLRLTDVQD
jgi:two-component system sensor histidine kinase UhpB